MVRHNEIQPVDTVLQFFFYEARAGVLDSINIRIANLQMRLASEYCCIARSISRFRFPWHEIEMYRLPHNSTLTNAFTWGALSA